MWSLEPGQQISDAVIIVDEIDKAEYMLQEQFKNNVLDSCKVLREDVLKRIPLTLTRLYVYQV